MQFLAVLRKDLLLQWRSRSQVFAVFFFGAVALLLFSFGIGPNAEALRTFAGGFLWLGLLLASTLSLAESFRTEMEQRALEGLLLLPVGSKALFYAKAVANWLQLTLLAFALVPVMVVLYDADASRVFSLCGVIALGTAGLSAPGTLYAAMSSQAKAQQVLLPLLLFPVIVPALLAAVRATTLLLEGDPMGQAGSWSLLLLAFDGIFWALSGLLFGIAVEE